MATRIVHLVGQLMRGGAERQLLHVTSTLKERGWTQAVITFNPGDTWDERLRQQGIPLFGVPRHPIKLWRLLTLFRLVSREQPEILHSWSDYTSVYACLLPRRARMRRLLSLRGNPMVDSVTGETLAQPRYLKIWERADGLVSNSQAALDVLYAHSSRIPKGAVVSNIVSAQGRAHPGELTDTPRIAAAGLLVPLKAYDVLLHALATLARQGQRFELCLAGEGPERLHLESLAVELGIRDRVQFLGDIEDVPGLFAQCHLLAHPSRSEGLSNTVLEGMAEGLPVVATDVGATPEVIKDGLSGFLFSPGQENILTRHLACLLEDAELRGRIGAAAYQVVESRFGAQTVAAQYEHIYHSLLKPC